MSVIDFFFLNSNFSLFVFKDNYYKLPNVSVTITYCFIFQLVAIMLKIASHCIAGTTIWPVTSTKRKHPNDVCVDQKAIELYEACVQVYVANV